jgi:hypothetical protein
METKRPSTVSARYEGRREMKNLALAAVSALDQSRLEDVLGVLHTRVFDRETDELCDMVEAGPGRWHCSYKPMVELLLREIVAVLKDRELSRDEQRVRICWAIDASGY